ncbi:MAG: DUF1015 domain-containing protein, partial [Deltaproteobacteria bacterium]
MATVRPLRGFVADPGYAGRLASPPYDVLTTAEARRLADGNPYSFLHVTRPEVDCPVDASEASRLRHGQHTLEKFCAAGLLRQDAAPCFYAYALRQAGHLQRGIILGASVEDYRQKLVRKHELTRPDKEADRVAHMEAVQAQTGKVFLLHRPHPAIAQLLQEVCAAAATLELTAEDGVEHSLWRIDDPTQIRTVCAAFAELGPLYIADGHHRAAAAARVAQHTAAAAAQTILAAAFCIDQVQILPYHRVVLGVGGSALDTFWRGVRRS